MNRFPCGASFRILAALTLLFALPVGAQEKEEPTNVCVMMEAHQAFPDIFDDGSVFVFPPTQEAEAVVGEFLRSANLTTAPDLRQTTVASGFYYSVEGTTPYLYYDDRTIRGLVEGNADPGVSMMLAHEIGHYYRRHSRSALVSNPRLELEADRFAGYLLRRRGFSRAELDDLQLPIMTRFGQENLSRDLRLAAVRNGWDQAHQGVDVEGLFPSRQADQQNR